MQAVVQCVAHTPKATVMADYENVKYYFPEPRDQDPRVRRTGVGPTHSLIHKHAYTHIMLDHCWCVIFKIGTLRTAQRDEENPSLAGF